MKEKNACLERVWAQISCNLRKNVIQFVKSCERGVKNANMNKLIVVKVGSSSLTEKRGDLAPEKLAELVRQIACLRAEGHRVVLVSSGAIAAGFRRLGFSQKPKKIAEKQASAAVGQGLLMEEYNRCFLAHGIATGQLLLTREDFSDARRFRNAYAALEVLLERGAVPIVNENDTVAIDEIGIGDNDTLSAQVAAMVHADLLVLLTDIDGLYTADPSSDPDARHIDRVEKIDDTLRACAGGAGSGVGTGGMQTKLSGASLATKAGVEVLICSSAAEDALLHAVAGDIRGTCFSVQHFMSVRRQWLAFHATPKGILWVDAGAAKALVEQKKSLLPPGVRRAEGDFAAGDVVEVCEDGSDTPIGRGIVGYAREELLALAQTPGSHGEAIHRDNWVTLL